MGRPIAQLNQRTCFGSSPKNAQCEGAFPQDRRDRSPPNQVVSLAYFRVVADYRLASSPRYF
jgi:hypothetical protein